MPSTLPDISRDKLDGFRKMAVAVIDDMHEAARDLANRHEYQVDLLKARVEEQDATIQKQRAAVRVLHDEAHEACDALAAATGTETATLMVAVENAVEIIATLRHRIDEAQKQMSAIAAEAAPEFFEATKQETLRAISAPLPGPALAAVPPQKGPFVITMKLPQGRRFWGPSVQGEAGWVSDLAGAFQYAGRVLAESVKPRRSAVVSLDDAGELIEAKKVVSITPPADAPTGPEAA